MDLCLMIERQERVTWPEWVALARACEEHGIPALFRSDHHLNLAGVGERGSLDAWAVINALAACTTSLHLGTLVSPVTFRHPFSSAGAHYSLAAVDAQPKPVQAPHPPLIMGGKGGPRAAALAARWADEYNTAFATRDELLPMQARVDAACEAAGREPIPFSLMTGVLVGRDRAEFDERRRLPAERGYSLSEEWIAGTVDEVAEQLATFRDAGLARVMCQHMLHTEVDMVALIGEDLAPMR